MLIGYARVSTDDQSLSLQRDALNKVGCKRIFTDKASGAPTQRPGLADALSHLRKGDSLVVWKLDRLGRSVKGLVDLVGEFETRQLHFRSLTDGIDTKTPAGRFFFHVMASLAQMERELIVERTRAGLGAARKLGRIGGRPWNGIRIRIDVIEIVPSTATPSGKRFANPRSTVTQSDIPISAARITKFREATVLKSFHKSRGL